MDERTALLVVDIQLDFCPGGALGVERGDEVIPILNEWIERFEQAGRTIILTRDWHPVETTHFQSGGGIWPPHCVQDTPGADFHPQLRIPERAIIVSKGADPNEDAYSAFHARDDQGRDLATILRALGIERLYIGGLATDYCVKESVLDARRLGFTVTVIEDAVRAVNLDPKDEERAKETMRAAGAHLV